MLIRKMQYSKNKGFTLIELLVVISIIGFLAAIVMSSLQTAREKALDTQIKSDMVQIKNAFELYATDNNYAYPVATIDKHNIAESILDSAHLTVSKSEEKKSFSISNFFLSIFGTNVYAQVVRDQKCIDYDMLSTTLVPKFVGNLPQHPLDNGEDVCYKYFANAEKTAGVVFAPLITDTYSNGYSRQVGFAFGAVDIESLKSICTDNLNTYPSGSTPFPLFSGVGDDRCDGTIADIVIGITSGGGDIPTASSCSIPGYDSQEECETDHSSCSDPAYSDEYQCTANGTYEGGGCSDGSGIYLDQPSCTGAGTLAPGYCSDGSGTYTDESSCINAGATPGYCSDGTGTYADRTSCVNAGSLTPGYCSDGSGTYTDEPSCVGAGSSNGYCSDGSGTYTDSASCQGATVYTPGYCSDGSGTYNDRTSCEDADGGDVYTWTDEQYGPGGYTWIDGTSSYGYTWTNEIFNSYGYTWTDSTSPFGYMWTAELFSSYGFTWSDGTYTPNIWTSSPAGVWGLY